MSKALEKIRTAISYEGWRGKGYRSGCAAASLTALDASPEIARSGCSFRAVVAYLMAQGHKLRRYTPSDVSLARVIREHPTGRYLLLSLGDWPRGQTHTMALIDGRLTDTELGCGRRKIAELWEVK